MIGQVRDPGLRHQVRGEAPVEAVGRGGQLGVRLPAHPQHSHIRLSAREPGAETALLLLSLTLTLCLCCLLYYT